jgi:hypothetical protein
MNPIIENDSYFLLLFTLPIALLVLWILLRVNRPYLGFFIGIGIIVIPTIFIIEYIHLVCQQLLSFCELIGFAYIILSVEAFILVLLYLGISFIIRKSIK